MKLTPHFTIEEFEHSSTAIARGISNRVTDPQARRNLANLCVQVLEPLRQYARRPIAISSGFRCTDLNRAVGGAATSNHLTGCAADLVIPDEATGRRWFAWVIANCPFDELIWEHSRDGSRPWIHVALRPSGNRHRIVANLVKSTSPP